MIVALGCDHAGFKLKETVKNHLREAVFKVNISAVRDFGTFSETSIDYPDIAFVVADFVSRSDDCIAVLICGTGAGMAITANKIPGIRATQCGDTFTARLVRQHNNANVLAIGARVTGEGLALDIVDIFINTSFDGGRHQGRIDKIKLYEEKNRMPLMKSE